MCACVCVLFFFSCILEADVIKYDGQIEEEKGMTEKRMKEGTVTRKNNMKKADEGFVKWYIFV